MRHARSERHGVLHASLVQAITAHRTEAMGQQMLAELRATQPTGLLLDLEGVPALNADELTWLSDLSIAAMLEGVRPALVGVGSELLNQLDDEYVHGGSSAALLHALVLTVRRSS